MRGHTCTKSVQSLLSKYRDRKQGSNIQAKGKEFSASYLQVSDHLGYITFQTNFKKICLESPSPDWEHNDSNVVSDIRSFETTSDYKNRW